MMSSQNLSQRLREYAVSLDINTRQLSKSSTLSRLLALCAEEATFDTHNNVELDFFSKKYDISQKLFADYDEKGRKVGDQRLDQAGLDVFAGLLYQRVLLAMDQGATEALVAKYINVCFKAFQVVSGPCFLTEQRPNLDALKVRFFALLPNKKLNEQAKAESVGSANSTRASEPITLALDVLFYEGPIARAYLETLHSLNLKPRKIVHLVAENDLVTGKRVGTFLPHGMRLKYAAAVQARKIHHWPHRLYHLHKALCSEIFDHLEEVVKFDRSTFMGPIDLKPLETYTDCVTSLPITSLKDSRILDFIKQQDSALFLFTGGGIVPSQFFELEGKRFLHIHPGYLPNIRGADCLLWSILLSGHPSATSFYLNSGIDTGDIIHPSWLPKIQLPAALSGLDHKTNYRLLYSFVDPWVRSFVLRETLRLTANFQNMHSHSQSIDSGTTFHFMHKDFVKDVISKIMKSRT